MSLNICLIFEVCIKRTPGQCKGHIGLSFPALQFWAVGVPLSGPLGWGHFSASPISDTFAPKKQTTGNRQRASELSVPTLGEAPGSLRLNLVQPNFAI